MYRFKGLIEFWIFLQVLCFIVAQGYSFQFGEQFYSQNKDGKGISRVFDFIVVGAGTAGCVIARRLAESGKHTVLLIEEGGIPHSNLSIPALSFNLRGDQNHFKIIPSVPQKHALLNNGIINYVYGRTLGGTSAVNGLVLNRGSPHDYDHWAKLIGDVNWSYAGLLKYFKRFENYAGFYPSYLRGFNGPITVTPPGFAPVFGEWLNAGKELGYQVVDPNGYQIISFTSQEFTKGRDGRRISSFDGYIRPILRPLQSIKEEKQTSHANLLILINSEVTKILFNEDKQAVGVEIVTNSTTYQVGAKKEIILSAGVIGSPILLQKSGVGPKSVLQKANIKIIKELPVGENLQDHLLTPQTIIFNNESAVLNVTRDLNELNFRIFNATGYGPYASYQGNGAQAFLATSNLNQNELSLGWPNIHILASHMARPSLSEGHLLAPDELLPGEVRVGWGVILTRPKSRGTVTLNTTSINDVPLLDFRYLTEPSDLEALVEAVKFTVRICEDTKAMQSIGCRLPRKPLPQCQDFSYRSDAYWTCFVRSLSRSGIHAGGTCPIEAVVDPQLRVIGLKGLRVADASIFPTIPNANPQAAVYAVAEKASELILTSWRSTKEHYSHY